MKKYPALNLAIIFAPLALIVVMVATQPKK